MIQGHILETEECHRVTNALARVGDKWAVLIVMQLAEEPRRFSELRRLINGISQKMLTLTLRGLERDGYIKRTVYPTNPPSVEYELTDLGQDMVVPVKTLGIWVLENLHRIEGARRSFDAKTI